MERNTVKKASLAGGHCFGIFGKMKHSSKAGLELLLENVYTVASMIHSSESVLSLYVHFLRQTSLLTDDTVLKGY